MSGLTDQINSKYFEAKNALNPSKGSVIDVYVEDLEDIAFWKGLFDKCELQTKIHPASQTSLKRGKCTLLQKVNDVGKYLILCVDSDYDYLLHNHTEQSKHINQNPYIFQTYTYSIENFKCYAENLHEVMLQATYQDQEELFDYITFLKSYSSIIYDLFLYSLYHIKKESKIFTHSDFLKTIKLGRVDILSQGQDVLTKLKETVEQKRVTLKTISEQHIQQLKTQLHQLGVTPENTYLFINGHILCDNVVLMFLKPLATHLKNKYYLQISKVKKTDNEENDREQQYNNLTTDITSILHHHTNYYDCFLMDKIFSDIETYKQNS